MKQKVIIFFVVLITWPVSLLTEKEGDFFREDINLPAMAVDPGRIDSLIFYLQSETGVKKDATGKIISWSDSSNRNLEFTAVTETEKPAILIPGMVNTYPVIRITGQQRRPGGFLSMPVSISPEKGLTLMILARVTQPVSTGFLLGYGPQYKTQGSLNLWLSGNVSYQRAVLMTGTGLEGKVLASSADNICGKGFVLLTVCFDPASHKVRLYEDTQLVGQATRLEPLAASFPFSVGVESRKEWSFSGDILAALAYNQALEEREIKGIHAFFATKYRLGGKKGSLLAPKLPYAYYPSRNQIEVAFELSPELKEKAGLKPGEQLKEAGVRIINPGNGKVVATSKLALDAAGRGQKIFSLPDLPDGEYAVEYEIGTYRERSPKTFQRIHFPFEKTNYGITHEVFPPFEPVRLLDETTVKVVGRQYRINGFGCLDSVRSLDRELLAAPIKLVGQTEGEILTWKDSSVSGKVLFEDEAVFTASTSSQQLQVKTRSIINEDGCIRVEMDLLPGKEKKMIDFLSLEIPLLEKEVPLFHFVADNGMRFNYAGPTPGKGSIQWYWEKWDGWVPIRWRITGPESEDGLLWTSADTRQHGNTLAWDHRPFVPYLWLGAEERGLAFFMESEENFETDYRQPLQRIYRRNGQVIIRVDIFQKPVQLESSRRIIFGLMASPGKPMEPEFRTRVFASGIGPVSCWGGWQCSSKYPDNQDWSIVDRIQQIRQKAAYTPEDEEFFQKKYEEVKSRWPDRRINGSTDWLWLTRHFAQKAAESGRRGSGIYFEEHATDTLLPEWQVFQDEWASTEFNRFQEKPANWGVFSPSYQDFALYMANEWMKRGVSLYFDNTYPKRCYNEVFGPAYRSSDGTLRYGITMFSQRQYYRRIYKLLQQWNRQKVSYPVDFTMHMTNTQVLPFTVWATATLDLEQRAQTEDPDLVPPETEVTVRKFPALGSHRILTEQMKKRQEAAEKKTSQKQGYQLPWPPDYTRTVTFGRQAGVIPLALDFVSGHGRHQAGEYPPAILLRDWAMRRIHDIRPGVMYTASARLACAYEEILSDFGYGKIEEVEEYNYWQEKSPLRISDGRVKWMALKKKVACPIPGLLLLQSYSRSEAVKTQITWPGMAAFLDVETREFIPGKEGVFLVTMPENLSTRMFLVSSASNFLQSISSDGSCLKEDFALVRPVSYDLTISGVEGNRSRLYPPEFLENKNEPGKRFWRMPAGKRTVSISFRDDWKLLEDNYQFSFRVRLPESLEEKTVWKEPLSLLLLSWRIVPEDKEKKTPAKMLQANILCQKQGADSLRWYLSDVCAVEGKQVTPLEPGREGMILLGQCAGSEWVEIGVRNQGTEFQFLFQGKAVASGKTDTGWEGTFSISQGKLLSQNIIPCLNLTDLKISRQP